MAKAVKRRRGTTEEHKTFVGLDGEITVDTTKKTLVLHDQETAGGFPLASEAMLNEAVEKIEEAEQTFVHKSGDENIKGIKTFTCDETPGTRVRINMTNTNMVVGAKPQSTTYSQLVALDKNSAYMGCFGVIQSALSGSTTSYIDARNAQNINKRLGIGYTEAGDFFTEAPTPPADDDSTQIATTEWATNRFAHNGNLTIYVRKTGNDNNDGLTEETAVLSIAKAMERMNSYTVYNGTSTINFGEGTWNEQLHIRGNNTRGASGAGILLITGQGEKSVLSKSSGHTITVYYGASVGITNLKIVNTAQNSHNILCAYNSYVTISDCILEKSNGGYAVNTLGNGYIPIGENVKIIGNNASSAVCAGISSCINISGQLELSGSFTEVIRANSLGGNVNIVKQIIGSVTGKRYGVLNGGHIETGGKGADFIPGTVAGTIDSGAGSIYH